MEELFRLVFEEVIVDPTPFVDQLKTIPIPTDLCLEFERPSKEKTVARHDSRFTQEVVGSQHTDQPSLESPGVSGLQHNTGQNYNSVMSTQVASAPANKAAIRQITRLPTVQTQNI